MNRTVRFVAIAVAGALVLASCRSAAEPDRGAESSPVGDVIDRLFSTGSVELLDVQNLRDVDEAIGGCMREQGFEYFPEPIDTGVPTGPVSVDGVEYGTKEWTARYGLGVSTQRYDPVLSNGELEGVPGGVGAEPVVNRNEQYVESLTVPGQVAYDAALNGAPVDTTERTQQEEQRSYDRSCEGRAVAEFAPALTLLDSLTVELMNVGERYASHPVVVQEAARVQRCVSEAGYDVMTEASAQTAITDRLAREVDRRIEWSDAPKLSPDGLAALKEIQELEVEWAQVLASCGGLSYQRTPEIQSVIDELRDEFLAKYVDP